VINAGPSPAGTNCPGEAAGDSNACKHWSMMVKYDSKSWGGVLAIDEIRGGPGAASRNARPAARARFGRPGRRSGTAPRAC